MRHLTRARVHPFLVFRTYHLRPGSGGYHRTCRFPSLRPRPSFRRRVESEVRVEIRGLHTRDSHRSTPNRLDGTLPIQLEEITHSYTSSERAGCEEFHVLIHQARACGKRRRGPVGAPPDNYDTDRDSPLDLSPTAPGFAGPHTSPRHRWSHAPPYTGFLSGGFGSDHVFQRCPPPSETDNETTACVVDRGQ